MNLMNSVSVLQQKDEAFVSMRAQRMSIQDIAQELGASAFVRSGEWGLVNFDIQGFRKFIIEHDKSGLSLEYDTALRKKSPVETKAVSSPDKIILVKARKKKSRVKKKVAKSKPKSSLESKPRAPRKRTELKLVSKPEEMQKCDVCQYEWPARKKTKCPACTFRVVTETNNLAYLHPQLALEYSRKNVKSAEEVCADRMKMFWWNCPVCHHEWEAFGLNRVNGAGCPSCAHRVASTTNNLSVTHPWLAREFSIRNRFRINGKIHVSKVLAGTTKKLWWKCPKGHEYPATGNNRLAGRGCPKCSAKAQSERMKKQKEVA